MTVESSPTARALLALELVQGEPGITADRIAERLGVSGRAARRYVAILREAGIPVVSSSGPAGGYRLGRGLRPPPMLFSGAEALALVMAVLDGHHDPADAESPVGSALAKLLRTLPAPIADHADAVRRTIAAAPDRASARPDPEVTTGLAQACADRRRVRIDYRTVAGRELSVEGEPWAVVVRHSRWYLLCHSVTSDGVRAYRVDRVGSVALLDASFSAPADLDAVATLEEHLGSGWTYAVEVHVDAPAERVAAWVPRTMGRVEPVDGARCRIVGSTDQPGEYAADLTRLPADYRVVAGDEVRAATAALAQRLARASDPSSSRRRARRPARPR